jgi:NitT/TauT family transport system permease protein
MKNKNAVIYSAAHLKYLKGIKKNKIIVWTFRIGILFLLIFFWELLAKLEIIDSFIMSSPSRIVNTIKKLFESGELLKHISVTLFETVAGFFIATILGSLIALLLWWSETLRKILDPYIVVLNSLPKIALGPIIIIWFGAGTKSIIFMAVLISIIITILTMLSGFLSTDSSKILLLKSMGAKKYQILTKLVLPQSLPTFISMLKINVGMAWIGSIMGEYLVSRAGLGYLIVYGGQVFKLDLVMASTVILCLLAAVMYFIVAIIEKFAVKWK